MASPIPSQSTAPLNVSRKPLQPPQASTTGLSARPPSPNNVPSSVDANGHFHRHAPGPGHGQASPHDTGKQVQGQLSGGDQFPAMNGLDTKCGGCQDVIDQESGGVVVAFGSSLWHVDCFRCAKCNQKVSADTNLLLLSDGSPVCGACSYQCFVCKEAITEEAIMTGDESYHAHCFTCRTCKKKIEELVFAKTSQGIYCMSCHNERVAKSRRHAEAKRSRQARREERDRLQREKDQDQRSREDESQILTPPLHPTGSPNHLHAHPAQTLGPGDISPFPTPRPHSPYATAHRAAASVDALEDARPVSRSVSPAGRSFVEPRNMPLPASPSESADGRPLNPPGSASPNSLPHPTHPRPTHSQSHSMGLNVPTSKAERRRSINPGMGYSLDGGTGGTGGAAGEQRFLGAHPPSPLRSSFTDAHISGSDTIPARSPTSPSPISLGNLSFPFKLNDGLNPSTSGDLQVPARTSSLPDNGGKDSQGHQQVGPGQQQEAVKTPKLNAPDLQNVSFSLSDPDFAVILSHMDRSPTQEKLKLDPESRAEREKRPELEITSGDSAPSSPLVSSPSLARSPHMDILSAIDSDPQSRGLVASTSRLRLSPNDGTHHPHMLSRRHASTESAISMRSHVGDASFERIAELLAAAKHREDDIVSVETAALGGIVREVEELREAVVGLKTKYTGAKRSSQQYSQGLSVAGEEYDRERSKRTELEAEVSRLRAQLHSQSARISVISGDEKRQEQLKRRSRDLASNLTGLERDISRLRAERDMKMAEVAELVERAQSGSSVDPDTLSQSLGSRLEAIRQQYAKEIEALSSHGESLQREIAELIHMKEASLEESAALSAKNEDLAELNTQLTRQTEALQDSINRARPPTIFNKKAHLQNSPSLASLTGHGLQDVPEEAITARVVKVTKPETVEAAPARRFKWYKSSKGPDASSTPATISKPLVGYEGGAGLGGKTRAVGVGPGGPAGAGGGMTLGIAGLAMGGMGGAQRPSTEVGFREHTFQQHTMMRFTRCELCSEKMWGLQEVKCSSCGLVCHSKCADKLPKGCSGSKISKDEPEGPLPPSMFGRPLDEQVIADRQPVPVIVTKCIAAVEAVGMEYEGIYRKTGGSSQSKQITQLFERGDYDSFDLADMDSFNDISAVTSVLKSYFRSLPNPLFTHELHESFVTAATIQNTNNKWQAVSALLKELPTDHYNTLKVLMLHLNRVTGHHGTNLMTSQNLGVVFGPTLMRSSDPNREFGDMAGKALSVQWLVDNAPSIFTSDLRKGEA